MHVGLLTQQCFCLNHVCYLKSEPYISIILAVAYPELLISIGTLAS